MYSGELEFQAKRKTIAILQEETNKILNLCRELAIMTDYIIQDNRDGVKESSDKIKIGSDEDKKAILDRIKAKSKQPEDKIVLK